MQGPLALPQLPEHRHSSVRHGQPMGPTLRAPSSPQCHQRRGDTASPEPSGWGHCDREHHGALRVSPEPLANRSGVGRAAARGCGSCAGAAVPPPVRAAGTARGSPSPAASVPQGSASLHRCRGPAVPRTSPLAWGCRDLALPAERGHCDPDPPTSRRNWRKINTSSKRKGKTSSVTYKHLLLFPSVIAEREGRDISGCSYIWEGVWGLLASPTPSHFPGCKNRRKD